MFGIIRTLERSSSRNIESGSKTVFDYPLEMGKTLAGSLHKTISKHKRAPSHGSGFPAE
jgi:hypothetical protein